MKPSGFHSAAIYTKKQPTAISVAKQKLSFMIATLSLLAFVMGNMIGQHGWYAFFKTVLGKEDDSIIAFVGTVPPIAQVPDYTEWAKYGGDKRVHTYSQVPKSVLRDLPMYDQGALTRGTDDFSHQVYSTLWAGGYNSPQGSHAGVDIDAPRGTPVQSIANGIVEKVSMSTVGFGRHVMIRHPNTPDGAGGTTTLYSTYAHMDTIAVTEGQIVHKGQQIGTVGNTGLVLGATGYHLYFEINKADAPFHPYWPFTSSEIQSAGLSFVQAVNSTVYQGRVLTYTLNPMAFVQQYHNYTTTTIAHTSGSIESVTAQSVASALSTAEQLRLSVAERRSARIAARNATQSIHVAAASSSSSSVSSVVSSVSSSASSVEVPTPEVVTGVVETVSISDTVTPPTTFADQQVDHLEFRHTGKLTGTWQKIRVDALDRKGDIVHSPSFTGRLYIISEFGEAVIRPAELTPLDFVDGTATINILSRSNKSLILATRGAFNTTSAPLVPER